MKQYYSHGKLLLTAEYVVLDGALALALPTKKGQHLSIESLSENKLIWKSLDENSQVWFEHSFDLTNLDLNSEHNATAKIILQLLKTAKRLNPEFLKSKKGYQVTTSLDFSRDWGLGSSSTLINNIANWADVDAYKLLESSFGGSGYDIACAQHSEAIMYQLKDNQRLVKSVDFNPKFSEHLYFVHLNKKQNSRDGIARYKAQKANLPPIISQISAISKLMLNCDSLLTFQALMTYHETIISKLVQLPTVKEEFFSDFNGAIKSLGAWGGDFILVASKNNPSDYFKNKGYNTLISYAEMILN